MHVNVCEHKPYIELAEKSVKYSLAWTRVPITKTDLAGVL